MQKKNSHDAELLDLAYSTTYRDSIYRYANMCETEEIKKEILALLSQCEE